MSVFAKFSAALVAVLWASLGCGASPTCYQYRVSSSLSWQNSLSSAGSEFASYAATSSYYCSGYPSWSCTFTYSSGSVAGGTPHFVFHLHKTRSGYPSEDSDPGYDGYMQTNPGGCPDCSAAEGSQAGLFRGDESEPPADMCANYSGAECRLEPDAVTLMHLGGWVGYYKFTGAACSVEPPAQSSDVNCVSGADGRVCVSKQNKNCGTVNGEQVCLASVPDGNCLLLSGGGAVCAEGSDAAPTDDMGAPAEPSAHFNLTSGGVTKSFNYYSSSVVSSSNTVVSGADNDASGGSGGSGGGGEVVEDCDSDSDCFGAPPSDECGDSLVACIGDAAAGVYDDFGATPLFSAVSGLYSAIPNSGTCPSATVDVFEQSVDAMASFCAVMADSGGDALLGLFFAIGWSLAGLRILLSGGE